MMLFFEFLAKSDLTIENMPNKKRAITGKSGFSALTFVPFSVSGMINNKGIIFNKSVINDEGIMVTIILLPKVEPIEPFELILRSPIYSSPKIDWLFKLWPS
ncbi:MAG: hypothetical protein LBH74_02520 [Nitrososphaerota archaeon]|jgi:hypothetical protein|nr:hypothetical protein [Nitrososphaerota archaeon]